MDLLHLGNKDKRKSLSASDHRQDSFSVSDGKRSLRGSPRVGPARSGRLVIVIESPPLVFYGNAEQSTGALFSGQLTLTATPPDAGGSGNGNGNGNGGGGSSQLRLETLRMRLVARVTLRKPVSKDCAACQTQTTELKTWNFLSEPASFKRGSHSFPFSYLLPGHLPATSHGQLGAIDYVLEASADAALEGPLLATHVLGLKRSLPPPSLDRTSTRIFPPTSLRAYVTHPPVVHPIGEFGVHLRLTGLVHDQPGLLRRWRLRKLTWRVDEHSRVISPACARHAHKVGGEGKGILHTETRTVGHRELRDGWKTDFPFECTPPTPGDDADVDDAAAVQGRRGVVEFDFACTLKSNQHHQNASDPPSSYSSSSSGVPHKSPVVCDVDDPSGFEVSHKLDLELVVAEEVAPARSPSQLAASGTARVLRMQFAVVVSERAGLGISWDEEQPPVYEDVPASPPGYARIRDLDEDLDPEGGGGAAEDDDLRGSVLDLGRPS